MYVAGLGASVAIGDAGTNTITTTMDLPRIFQIYRSFEIPPGSGYAPNFTAHGFVFTSGFDLHPNPLRHTDSQGLSIIDALLTMSDVSKSNVLRDILGISSIMTKNGYCIQPMFKVIPGFLSETNMLNGNDVIVSEGGGDIVIGDDIRGFSAVDLTEVLEFQNSRRDIDNLIVDLSVRLSTLEYDSEFYAKYSNSSTRSAPFNLIFGCDNITTSKDSYTIVVGDTLTLLGRTYRGVSFPNPLDQIPQLYERVRDVQHVLVDLHHALYEIHVDLLRRSKKNILIDFKKSQQPLHKLHLTDDTISLKGNGTIVGDSATLFFQIDSPFKGFEFSYLGNNVKLQLAALIADNKNLRQMDLEKHIKMELVPTPPLTSQEENTLPFADVPYYLSIGNDRIDLYDNSALAVGDFGAFGIVYSEGGTSTDVTALRMYASSVNFMRKPPSVQSFLPSLSSLDQLDRFFYMRYNASIAAQVRPTLHGDTFVGRSSNNVIFGDFLTASMVGFASGQLPIRDTTIDFYDTYVNAQFVLMFSPDVLTVPTGSGSPIWVGQVLNDIVNGTVTSDKADEQVQAHARLMFGSHTFAKQSTSDLYRYTNPYPFEAGNEFQNVCYISETSYIPSHTQSIYMNITYGTELNHTQRDVPLTTTSPVTTSSASPSKPPTNKPSTAGLSKPPTNKPTTAGLSKPPTNKPTMARPAPTNKPTTTGLSKAPTNKPTTAGLSKAPTRAGHSEQNNLRN